MSWSNTLRRGGDSSRREVESIPIRKAPVPKLRDLLWKKHDEDIGMDSDEESNDVRSKMAIPVMAKQSIS